MRGPAKSQKPVAIMHNPFCDISPGRVALCCLDGTPRSHPAAFLSMGARSAETRGRFSVSAFVNFMQRRRAARKRRAQPRSSRTWLAEHTFSTTCSRALPLRCAFTARAWGFRGTGTSKVVQLLLKRLKCSGAWDIFLTPGLPHIDCRDRAASGQKPCSFRASGLLEEPSRCR